MGKLRDAVIVMEECLVVSLTCMHCGYELEASQDWILSKTLKEDFSCACCGLAEHWKKTELLSEEERVKVSRLRDSHVPERLARALNQGFYQDTRNLKLRKEVQNLFDRMRDGGLSPAVVESLRLLGFREEDVYV